MWWSVFLIQFIFKTFHSSTNIFSLLFNRSVCWTDMKIQQYLKVPWMPPLPNADQSAAEKAGESRGSCTTGAKQTGEFKKNMKEIRPGTLDSDTATHAATSVFTASCWSAFCFVFLRFVFTCRMSKMFCHCVLTAVARVIMQTFMEQNNNVKQALTCQDTWSNLTFIYVSGRGGKKKHNLKVLLWEKSYVLSVPHTDPYTPNASYSCITHTKGVYFDSPYPCWPTLREV